MSNYSHTYPCGCVGNAYDRGRDLVPGPDGLEIPYTYELTPCPLHKAAPDLLNACNAALSMPAPIDRRIVEEQLRSAIKKAKAES